MEHFAGNTDEIKIGALDRSIREYFAEHIHVSLPDLTDRLYEELRVNMAEKQKQNYDSRLVRKLAIEIKDGTLSVAVK